MTPASVLPEILQMSEADQIELANAIWDSVVDENEPIQLTEAQKRLIDERLEDRKANPEDRRPWGEFEAEMLGKYR
jgi:putative addiction module component (TIGR02574 family)